MRADGEILSAWWRVFEDEQLVQLVAATEAENHDLQKALGRIAETAARRDMSGSQLYPQADALLDFATRRVSGSGNPFVVSGSSGFDFYSSKMDSIWELDLWGKYRRSLEAAAADAEAAMFDFHAVRLSLIAEAAASYIQMRGMEQRIDVQREIEQLQAKSLQLAQARRKAGLARQLDVIQAETQLHRTRAGIPPLLASRQQLVNRLAALQGIPPGQFQLAPNGRIPLVKAPPSTGVPAELLRRRPDVRSAERNVAASSARIGVATAEFYPQLTLKGNIGVDTRQLDQLFADNSLAFQFGPERPLELS